MILNTPSNTFAKYFAGLLLMSTGKRLNKGVQWYDKGFMPHLNIVFSVWFFKHGYIFFSFGLPLIL